MRRIGFLLVLATLASGVPAAAQAPRPASPPAPREPYPAIAPRGFVLFGQQHFAAEQSFDAVFDKSTLPFVGGGADIVIQRNIFAEIAFSHFEATGERVFQVGDDIFQLGVGVTSSISPFEVSGGYRLTNWRRVIPYVGVGIGNYHYKETSEFSDMSEDIDESRQGFIVLGGAEVRLMRLVGLSLDVHYTSVGDIIGAGGISEAFGEDDLGGTAIRIRIMIGR